MTRLLLWAIALWLLLSISRISAGSNSTLSRQLSASGSPAPRQFSAPSNSLTAGVGEMDLRQVPDRRNYSCDEIVRWLGTEKHYSNDKKNVLFGLFATTGPSHCQQRPYLLLHDISFGKTFFHNPRGPKQKKCSQHDNVAVVFLSNYSINHNFSHFLHALLRLFCALLDSEIIVWNASQEQYVVHRPFTLWLDEYFKLNPMKSQWISSLGGQIRSLKGLSSGQECVSSQQLIYGSGCVRLLPPEKWFGYPGCRAGEVLRAFGTFMRGAFQAPTVSALHFVDHPDNPHEGLRMGFAVRAVGALTGMRSIANLETIQHLLQRSQHVKWKVENITFEHLNVSSTVQYMAGVHVFVSVHGAGMTNMFFMNPGSAVVEIIPYPLCNCRSPDYFYGIGGYYHGSAIAQGIRHYHYCVPAHDVRWHKKPEDLKAGSKCSWRHLHAVESVMIEPSRFLSLLRNVERDLIAAGTIVLTRPVINISPHANG
eukprot:scaffold7160_cov156-Ochromonas_danica.AAC.10